ncbi:putative mRNA cleavage and polyadenylation factor CLP1 P-loop [Leishmania shawi]|uniref:mRNA cleavage and polyadenylation factor CLP1 P-loop n=1 Tax=Leishmania shawi TaxID=5680 RepID=A0AAW3C9F9_9TRYP
MPARRGTRIVDTRPQSVADGVGSAPLLATLATLTEQAAAISTSTATTTATAAVTARGCRVVVSGVEEIQVATPTNGGGSDSSAVLSGVGHFKVPAAVLQRIPQQGQSTAETHATNTNTTACSTASTSEAGMRAGEPVPLPQTPFSTRGGTRGRAKSAKASSSDMSAPPASLSRAPDSPTVASELTFASQEGLPTALAVSDAAVSTTVAAHTMASSSHAQVDSKERLLLRRQQKPVVFSRQWRRHLFNATASSSLPLTSSKPIASSTVEDALQGHRQSIGRRTHGCVSESGADRVSNEEDDDNEDGASPFGNASIIKLSRTEDREGVPGRLPAVPPSSESDDGENRLSLESLSTMHATAVEALEGSHNGVTLQSSGAPTRRQRHQLRQRAQEEREHHRVRRHMAGYDPDFLSRQESQLHVNKKCGSSEESEAEDEGSGEYSSEETAYSASSTAESESLTSLSEAGGDEKAEEAEEDGDTNDDLLGSSAPAPHEGHTVVSGGGLCAAERTEHERHQHAQYKGSTVTPPPLIGDAHNGGSGTVSTSARSLFFQSFFFACHEIRLHPSGCHHTLVGLQDSVTIKGPCGIIGFGLGEVSVSGFYLGRKQLTLWHEEHRAVLMPMKRLKTRHAQDMELPQWPRVPAPAWPPGGLSTAAAAEPSRRTDVGDVLGHPLNPLYYRGVCAASGIRKSAALIGVSAVTGAPGTGEPDEEEEEEAFLQSLQWGCESVFGEVDWDWVEATVQSWRSLFSNQLPPILLILQPPSSLRRHADEGPTRRFYLTRKRGRQYGTASGKAERNTKEGGALQDAAAAAPSSAYMDIPSFVAHRSEPSVDLALVPSIVPSIAAQGCGSVMVLGSANIGKSTLCRYLANTLLSQHGLCYWLDLDVGQPEFGVPGQLTLSVLRRPLLRAHDASCAQVVSAFFVGGSTATQCPLTAANALAAVCAQAREVSKAHPVVVNTHGWVLQTGRRISVEALRRLRPRQVIHLYKAQEELWAQDTAALLDPRNGLNAEVVQRRFLVRHRNASSAAAAVGGERADKPAAGSKKRKIKGAPPSSTAPSALLLCRLPYPYTHEEAVQQAGSSDRESPVSPPTTAKAHKWCGQVHSVRVQREDTYSSIARIKAMKGSRGRQQRWETYFSALFRHYVGSTTSGAKAASKDSSPVEDEAETTLLEAPLSALHSIVLAERDEKLGDVHLAGPALPSSSSAEVTSPVTASVAAQQRQTRQTHAEVAAALEHAVVAVLFHARPSAAAAHGQSNGGERWCVVRSLASLQNGFPVSCYGVVESCEQELLHGVDAAQYENGASSSGGDSALAGWIRVRVPLRPSVVAAMLSIPEAGLADVTAKWSTNVSIAYSAALRSDTAFADTWR